MTDSAPVTPTEAVVIRVASSPELLGIVRAREIQNDIQRLIDRNWGSGVTVAIEREAAAPAATETLRAIEGLQPKALGYIRRYGFVMDKVGPLTDDATELDRWKVLAFSLYSDLAEANAIAERALASPEPTPKPDGWHTYHICDGLLRELTFVAGRAYCLVCDQWYPPTPATGLSAEALRAIAEYPLTTDRVDDIAQMQKIARAAYARLTPSTDSSEEGA